MYFAYGNCPAASCPRNGMKVPSGRWPSRAPDRTAEIVAEQSPCALRKLKDVRIGPPDETHATHEVCHSRAPHGRTNRRAGRGS